MTARFTYLSTYRPTFEKLRLQTYIIIMKEYKPYPRILIIVKGVFICL